MCASMVHVSVTRATLEQIAHKSLEPALGIVQDMANVWRAHAFAVLATQVLLATRWQEIVLGTALDTATVMKRRASALVM